jgi:dephospho-CoA kinase
MAAKTAKVAITGGIATGKSTVSKMFEELGAVILDADQVAREVVAPGSPCWERLRQLVGPSYFGGTGELKRAMLRDLIIADPQCREQVNAILHPAILERMNGEWRRYAEAHDGRPVIFDIPLLFEGKWDRHFETIVLVYVPREIQIRRLMDRDGLSRPEAEKTLTMQLPIDAKKALSHIIIDNSKDLEHTLRQVKAVWNQLKN